MSASLITAMAFVFAAETRFAATDMQDQVITSAPRTEIVIAEVLPEIIHKVEIIDKPVEEYIEPIAEVKIQQPEIINPVATSQKKSIKKKKKKKKKKPIQANCTKPT